MTRKWSVRRGLEYGETHIYESAIPAFRDYFRIVRKAFPRKKRY